jgi:hypothetical protein
VVRQKPPFLQIGSNAIGIVGSDVGQPLGVKVVGFAEGFALGVVEGLILGFTEDGTAEGLVVGFADGTTEDGFAVPEAKLVSLAIPEGGRSMNLKRLSPEP